MEMVRRYVRALDFGTVLVSGGARGVDRIAETEARKQGIAVEVYPADWSGLGKSAGFRRNVTIVEKADAIAAFWDGRSRGTKHTIDLAKKAGKTCAVFMAPEQLPRGDP